MRGLLVAASRCAERELLFDDLVEQRFTPAAARSGSGALPEVLAGPAAFTDAASEGSVGNGVAVTDDQAVDLAPVS